MFLNNFQYLMEMVEKLVIFTTANFYELERTKSIELGLKMINFPNQFQYFGRKIGHFHVDQFLRSAKNGID